jgi:hypothetical protein
MPADALMKALGLRGRDIPSLLWELTPWSFVVDWFANVGTWLQAVVPDPSISIRGNWVTVIRTTEVKYSSGTLIEPHSHPVSMSTGMYGGSSIRLHEVHRYANQPLPTTPVLMGKALSVLQKADALCLGVSQLSGLLKTLRH